MMFKARFSFFLVMILSLLSGACCAQEDFYTDMPPYLRVTQKMESETVVPNVYIRRTYPDTANDTVDEQIRILVDEMAERSRDLLPQKGNKTVPAYLDAGAVITRTGTSWMSFLTVAEVSANKEHLSVEYDARVYDIETGKRIALTDVFAADSEAWELLGTAVREQLSAAFDQEEPDEESLEALCSRERLQQAAFTMGAARMTLTYRADEIYPGKKTLVHVHLYYPQIRRFMTEEAQAQTDNSRFEMVALTFDDGGARGSTRRVLDQLRMHGAQATFFVVGQNMRNNHDILSRQQNAAYSIQSHSYTHRYPTDLTGEEALKEKEKFRTEVSSIIGVEPTMMRAPGGRDTFYIRQEIGYPMIQWSVAGGDSGNKDVLGIYKRVVSRARDGEIILLHDLNSLSGEYTRHILQALNQQGVLCVTVEELFADAGIVLEENQSYYSARNDN